MNKEKITKAEYRVIKAIVNLWNINNWNKTLCNMENELAQILNNWNNIHRENVEKVINKEILKWNNKIEKLIDKGE